MKFIMVLLTIGYMVTDSHGTSKSMLHLKAAINDGIRL